jgi:predicted transposase YbfD/YdcC
MLQKDFIAILSGLEDHRMDRKKEHLLIDIVVITLAGVVCGAENWNQLELFGNSKLDWFRTFLKLPNGIPSHDTFNRFYSQMDPDKLELIFREWVNSIAKIQKGELICVDGKTIRGAKEHGKKSLIHMVSAWASVNCLVLGQVKVDDKSNEITAIPELLDSLFIEDCVISIDAMGCQKEIVKTIRRKNANYILAVKGNQKTLELAIEDSFRFLKADHFNESLDAGHGRIETRKCSVITNLEHLENIGEWLDIKSIIKIESTRYDKVKKTTEEASRIYISSLDVDPSIFQAYIRSHWGIENNLHWMLDVAFNEDKSRKRAGNSAQNFSSINKMALIMLKNETSVKGSIMTKRLNAGWNETFLKSVLGF